MKKRQAKKILKRIGEEIEKGSRAVFEVGSGLRYSQKQFVTATKTFSKRGKNNENNG